MRSLDVGPGGASLYWLTAPRAGVIVERTVLAGQEVGPDRTEPLLVIADLGEVIVTADVPEDQVSMLAVGEAARVRSAAAPDRALDGRVEYVGEVVDPTRRMVDVRVRLTDVAASALSIEVFAYILTREYNEYAAIREDLLLRILDVVENSGGTLALPSQTLYLSRDAGVQQQKAENAAKKIADLRDGKQLPFPDFHPDEISSFKGSIEYPPSESTLRKQQGDGNKGR